MPQLTFTYSFKDVHATISGPGGFISLGNGAGAAEEGITLDQVEDKTVPIFGADGSVAYSLVATNAFRATFRLLKTSPTNQQLGQMYATQKTSSLFWGQNVISVTNNITGDTYAGAQGVFMKFPSNNYAKVARIMEWEFMIGQMEVTLGGAGLLIP